MKFAAPLSAAKFVDEYPKTIDLNLLKIQSAFSKFARRLERSDHLTHQATLS